MNQLASQDGPDVWLIPSEWLPKHLDKLTSVPEGFLAQQNLAPAKPQGFIFKKTPPTPTNATLYPKLFEPVTAQNNIINGKIAAIPLSIDTLGLYANTSALNAAGIQSVPFTWEQIVEDVKKLTQKSGTTITKSAIGLGTSSNISRATDILATLFMQNHTPMISDDRQAALYNQTITKSTGELIKPGELALDFYTSFASPTKETYTWNANLPSDFDQFSNGNLPLMIDYSYRIQDLIQKNPTLPFTTAPMPQIENTDQRLTLATSQMAAVPISSKNQQVAWNFIEFLANKDNSLRYDRATSRPPARLDLADAHLFPSQLAPFIAQLPDATTWYRNEVGQTNNVFTSGIDAVLAGQPISDVVDKMSKQVTHILRNEAYQ